MTLDRALSIYAAIILAFVIGMAATEGLRLMTPTFRTSDPHGLADARSGHNSAAQRLHHFGPIQPMEPRRGWIARLLRMRP